MRTVFGFCFPFLLLTSAWIGCSSSSPTNPPLAELVTQDDAVTAKPAQTVKVNLLENDSNPIDGAKFLRFRVPTDKWGKPGTLIEPGWSDGQITYKVPKSPGVYSFDYMLYGHDPSLSHDPDFAPPKPTKGTLTVTVESNTDAPAVN